MSLTVFVVWGVGSKPGMEYVEHIEYGLVKRATKEFHLRHEEVER